MSSIEGKRVLVTGSLGFTGHYVTQALRQEGAKVFGCGFSAVESCDFPYYSLDLTDALAVQVVIETVQPHIVIHLAAISFVGHADAAAFYQVNLLGTYHLLLALSKSKTTVEKVLIASSANVYGNAATDTKISEMTPYQPENDYAVSKVAMEQMVALWFNRLPIVITRPFNYTGVGQAGHFLIPKIVTHFKKRSERIRLGNLDVSRDYTDVRTLTDAYVKLLKQPKCSVTVNLCSGKAWRLDEILTLCQNITGHRITVDQHPALMRDNEIKYLCGDAALLNQLIGADMQLVPFEQTLAWMLEY